MTFPNGSVFQGTFVHDNPVGPGKLTTINGEVLDGFWEFHGRADVGMAMGKYSFHGTILDTKNNERMRYDGALALYLRTGLVSLPNMPDPMESMLPYAVAMADSAPKDAAHAKMLAEEGRSLLKGSMEGTVPVANVVSNAPTSSSSIAYGRPDVNLEPWNPNDHARVSLLDPRLYLSAVGVPVQPANLNKRQQQEIRLDREQRLQQQEQHRQQVAGNGNTPVAVAVPVDSGQQRGPIVFSA